MPMAQTISILKEHIEALAEFADDNEEAAEDKRAMERTRDLLQKENDFIRLQVN